MTTMTDLLRFRVVVTVLCPVCPYCMGACVHAVCSSSTCMQNLSKTQLDVDQYHCASASFCNSSTCSMFTKDTLGGYLRNICGVRSHKSSVITLWCSKLTFAWNRCRRSGKPPVLLFDRMGLYFPSTRRVCRYGSSGAGNRTTIDTRYCDYRNRLSTIKQSGGPAIV